MTIQMTELSDDLYYTLRDGVSTVGYENALNYIEEGLTVEEHKDIEAFMEWVLNNNRTFGWNLKEVWAEWIKEIS